MTLTKAFQIGYLYDREKLYIVFVQVAKNISRLTEAFQIGYHHDREKLYIVFVQVAKSISRLTERWELNISWMLILIAMI